MRKIPAVSPEESQHFFGLLFDCKGAKPAVLATVEPYCSMLIPASLADDLPMPLSNIFQKEYLILGYSDLLQKSKATTLTVTDDQAKGVESKTRSQSKSRVWFSI